MAQTRTNSKTDTPDVSAQIDTIKEEIATLNALIADLVAGKSAEAKKEASETAAKLKNKASEQLEHAQEQATAAGKKLHHDAEAALLQAETVMKQQPAFALGIAAGLGFLVGLLMTRR